MADRKKHLHLMAADSIFQGGIGLIQTELLPLGNKMKIAVSKNHTFGTDAILLANFASPKPRDRAVDLGTGCGIIPLLWLRDNTVKNVAGVDIQSEACMLTESSAKACGMSDRLSVKNCDIKDVFSYLPKADFDVVTCNPPYKADGAGLKNTTVEKQIARHEVACSLTDIITAAAGLLRFGGRFCICQRPERLAEIMTIMSEKRLEPKRMRLVCKTVGCEPWLVLVEGRLGGNKGIRILPTLYMEQNGVLTDELLAIYGPYKAEREQQ